MRICLDFEFMEDGRTIDPLSVGMVNEDGAEYYAEFGEADLRNSNPWVVEHVFPNLKSYIPGISFLTVEDEFNRGMGKFFAKSTTQIRYELIKFCGEEPEFWGYFCDYDWVTLCQIFGRMVDLPKHWPMYCLDLKQEMYNNNITKEMIEGDHPQPTTHNALDDAKWINDALLWVWSY